MSKPPIPINEKERLAELHEYNILDTLTEPIYDDLTWGASVICKTPISLISMVDADRQWFKSKRGVDLTETSRDISFCAHAVYSKKPLVVEDALKDTRFLDNPLVTGGPKIRFYAGIPLLTSTGNAMGTICVLDNRPRQLTEEQLELLQVFARQAMAQLESRKTVSQVIHKTAEIEKANVIISQQVNALNESSIVAFTDPNGAITFVNDLFCAISGYTKEELIGQNHRILNSGFHSRTFFVDLWSTIKNGKTWRGEIKNRAKDGSYYWVQTTIMPFKDIDGKVLQFVAIRTDITNQKLSETRLIQASKMSALGEMAAGIAHEINNPLTIIMGKTEKLISRYADNSEFGAAIVPDLKKIKATTTRIANVVSGLKKFSQNGEKEPLVKVKVDSIIQDTVALCHERFATHGVNLGVTSNPEMMIECRPTQISQVLLNLLNNAHDAIENQEQKWIRVEISTDENASVLISITDSGAGISADLREKIMLPFFTTKEVGRGTGLGLSISKGIVHDYGGELLLDVNSVNTRFVVRLPLVRPQ